MVYAVLSAGLVLFLLWAFLLAPTSPGSERVEPWLAVGAFAGPVLFGVYSYRMTRIRFTADEHGVEVRNVFRRARRVPWDRIDRFTLGRLSGRTRWWDRIPRHGLNIPRAERVRVVFVDGTSMRIDAIEMRAGGLLDDENMSGDAVFDLNRFLEHLHEQAAHR